jgi:ribonuclease D
MNETTNCETTTTHNAIFIDKSSEAAEICKYLSEKTLLGFDMEGLGLGRNGTTSLLQLSASADEVYVFDVLALGHELFSASHLLPILSSHNIIKLCYDCRCDAEALFHQHGVLVNGLYDLQIVYTALFQNSNDKYLKGLHKALQSPGILKPTEIECMVKRKLAAKQEWAADNFDLVLARPLSEDFLQYCAADVAYLFRMYKLWSPHVCRRLIIGITQQRMKLFIHLTQQQIQIQKKHMSLLDFSKSLSYLPRSSSYHSTTPAMMMMTV